MMIYAYVYYIYSVYPSPSQAVQQKRTDYHAVGMGLYIYIIIYSLLSLLHWVPISNNIAAICYLMLLTTKRHIQMQSLPNSLPKNYVDLLCASKN